MFLKNKGFKGKRKLLAVLSCDSIHGKNNKNKLKYFIKTIDKNIIVWYNIVNKWGKPQKMKGCFL